MTTTDLTPATDPVRAEALDQSTIAVPFDGATYTVPRDLEDWPMAAMEAMEDGKAVTALRALLPATQWAAFKATGPSIRAMSQLLDAIAVEAGFKSAGE
ncbi:hypothetical protein QOZ88_05985 [Blastococcus sp. BMG 814]|uniref:Phage tail assembly chaperone protein, E, or 41 or 14 n=1 Tax=Blastococcus carthaginiensis TaxID=3050034 RepID=A0ABT9I9D9_9ACTN|nr:hypothetical protein [Blastococcus carthaginiensis]MDP5182180.1 hypothetical protein [Blastococcus carthaginiensis]